MPDTRRSRSDLLALFPDNTLQEISAQDLRDFLVSIMGGYASIKTVDGSTPFAVSGTPVKLTTFDTNGTANGLVPDHTTDNITIDIDGIYFVSCNISFSGTLSRTFELHLRVDGVERDEGIHRKLGTGGDVGSTGFSGVVSLSAGVALTVFADSPDGGTSMTPIDGQFTAHQIA